MSGYIIEIKPSARRSSRVAGEWVHESGPRRRFASKALAREWARTASADEPVWVQDVPAHDPSPVDGYLVGGRRTTGSRATAGSQSSLDGE
ncbi:hypothetical protein [Halococcus saccharolyticus]|uniref:DUF8081 domain-containing protein n=1 Tax=Halococcus saccharolyticus DSM 5350 TaxID=1227455 RepID=M0MKP0_9EURY|nr:hypothetical protein [Halococcus saccharolyticus]EMA46262.1 hypothetical protein C449_04495 [Halococcus saccharolyticus DSM 5350]